MAEGSSIDSQSLHVTRSDDKRNSHLNQCTIAGRRPLSDSSIKYEENAFNDSPQVKLVHFSARRNSSSIQTSSEDGDYSSDDGSKPNSSLSENNTEESSRLRSLITAKTSYDCDCPQSRKEKRKAAKNMSTLSSLPMLESDETKSNPLRKHHSLMRRMKSLFRDPSRQTNCTERKFRDSKLIQQDRRSKKENIQKKERRYIIADILAITSCSYYWGSINRHEAEELLCGKTDGTFLLRDSAHKDHLFSVSFRRYNKTLHARIEQWDHKYSFDHESPVAYFSLTIEGLLSHYSIGEYCMFFEPMLVKPLIRAQPQPLMSLCRAAIGNSICYDNIEDLPIPSSLKIYLR